MKRKTGYLPLPIRQVTDLRQIYSERDQFVMLLFEVLLLGLALNYLASILYELFNTPGAFCSVSTWVQLAICLAITASLFFATTRIGVLKPIEMHTVFYTGILVKPGNGETPSLILAPPADQGKTSAQRLVWEIGDTYQGIPFQNPDEMADLLQFAVLIWYHHTFAVHWLQSPVLRTLGSEVMVGVEGADKSFIDAPQGIRDYTTNRLLRRCAELREAGTAVYGNAGLPSQFIVPPEIQIGVEKEVWDVPHLRGRTRACYVLFEGHRICTVKIAIAVVGQSALLGKEGLLPSLSDLPGELGECYSFNYRVSVNVQFTENLPLRLGWGRDKSKIERYYRWSRDILEGLEEDFCWPLSLSEQCVDWEA